MCGIAGCINLSKKLVNDYVGFMRDAVLVGQVRGDDSVGIGWIGANTDDAGVHKDVLPASSFLTTKKSLDVIGNADANYFTMVHHRAKTIGDVTVAAAQPFHYLYGPKEARKDMIVAHNGTLNNYKLKEGDVKFVSDSDWLSWRLASANIIEEDGTMDIGTVLEDMTGAYSVVVATESHVYFANNGKRPMSVAFTEDGLGLLFASEAGMLNWLVERNNLKVKGVYTLEPYTLYTVPLGATSITMTETSIEDYTSYYGGNVTNMYPRGTTTQQPKQSLDEWYKALTGKDPTPPAKSEPKTSLVKTDGTISPSAITELIGLNVSCMFNELDVNKGTAYGIGWIDQEVFDGLGHDAAFILSTGGVMLESGLALPALDANTVYVGKIEGLCTVQEMEAGQLVKRPYIMIAEESLREEGPADAKEAMAAIGAFATV